jgi:aerotaxis receptor
MIEELPGNEKGDVPAVPRPESLGCFSVLSVVPSGEHVKNNRPVTQVQVPHPQGRHLVSKTDLRGVVTYANDTFVEQSGFNLDELIGKSHNIVRHPDMPPQAFEHLWRTIKAGLPWTGIVKNRSKAGDFYWDHAVAEVEEGTGLIRKSGEGASPPPAPRSPTWRSKWH